jgi:hypothetical protein
LPIRARFTAAYAGVLTSAFWGDGSAVGLDAGRGTTLATSVASALQPLKIWASGRHRVDHGALQLG